MSDVRFVRMRITSVSRMSFCKTTRPRKYPWNVLSSSRFCDQRAIQCAVSVCKQYILVLHLSALGQWSSQDFQKTTISVALQKLTTKPRAQKRVQSLSTLEFGNRSSKKHHCSLVYQNKRNILHRLQNHHAALQNTPNRHLTAPPILTYSRSHRRAHHDSM